jgi:hypothetical protein
VFHTKGFSLGGDLGISPLEAARQGLSISLATEQAAGTDLLAGDRAIPGFSPARSSRRRSAKSSRKTFIDPDHRQ